MAVFEICGSGPEDKVSGAGDVAFFVILPARVCQDCVLMTEESAFGELASIASDRDSQSLADRAG